MNQLRHQQIEPTQGPVKRVYNQPRLEIYGELREITKSIGCTGNDDNIVNTLHCGFQLRTAKP